MLRLKQQPSQAKVLVSSFFFSLSSSAFCFSNNVTADNRKKREREKMNICHTRQTPSVKKCKKITWWQSFIIVRRFIFLFNQTFSTNVHNGSGTTCTICAHSMPSATLKNLDAQFSPLCQRACTNYCHYFPCATCN